MPKIMFQNEAQRMAHPQARLIPKLLLQKLHQQPTFIFELMELTNDELIDFFNEANLGCLNLMSFEAKWTWAAMAVSHPTLNNEQLFNISTQLKLSTSDLFESACLLENLEFLRYLFAQLCHPQHEVSNILKFDKVEILVSEAKYFPVLKFILEKNKEVNEDDFITDCTFLRMIDFATQHGNLTGIKYLLSKTSVSNIECLAKTPEDVFSTDDSVKSGNLSVLSYLFALFPQWLENSKFMMGLFRSAAINGHLETLKYIVAQSKPPTPLENIDLFSEGAWRYSRTFNLAAQRGHLPVMNYLKKLHPQQCKIANIHQCLKYAAITGNLALIKSLIDEGPLLLDESDVYVDLLEQARINGHWQVIDYLFDKKSQCFKGASAVKYSEIFAHAAYNDPMRPQGVRSRRWCEAYDLCIKICMQCGKHELAN